jgi:hypothetical protein
LKGLTVVIHNPSVHENRDEDPMIAKVVKKHHTLQDLLAMSDEAGYELVDGHLVGRNVSVLSSLVEGFVYDRVLDYVRMTDGGLGPVDSPAIKLECLGSV